MSAAGAAMAGSYCDHRDESGGTAGAGEPEVSESDGYSGGSPGCGTIEGRSEADGIVSISYEGQAGGLGWVEAGFSARGAGFRRVYYAGPGNGYGDRSAPGDKELTIGNG